LLGDFPTAGKTIVSGIISNKHKLLVGSILQSGWTGPFYPNATIWDGDIAIEICEPACLFDIFADPTEHKNIASTNPLVVQSLLLKILEAQRTVFNPNRGTIDPAACQAALNKYKGYWGPFVN